jgi:hypothetical protein
MTQPLDPLPADVETDPRFPSGPWKGFFLQSTLPGRNWMDLHLMFRGGRLSGEGRDRIGQFALTGRYDLNDGQCRFTKKYIGLHSVYYQGYNEGKGIWGRWELWGGGSHGGFHIWPVGHGFADPSTLLEAVELPVAKEAAVLEPMGVT